jgi:hypothetical protein
MQLREATKEEKQQVDKILKKYNKMDDVLMRAIIESIIAS